MEITQCGSGPFDSVLHISLLHVFEAGHALGWKWNGKLTGIAQSLASPLRLSSVTMLTLVSVTSLSQ